MLVVNMAGLAVHGVMIHDKKIGLQRNNTLQLETAPPQHRIQRNIGTLRSVNRRQRVDCFQTRFDDAQLVDGNEFGFVKHNLIGKGDLFNSFATVGEAQQNVFGVDNRGNRIEYGTFLQKMIDEEGLRHRAGIGQAGGLDDDGIERFCAIGLPRQQAVQGADQVAAHRAADAAVVHLEQLFVGVQDEVVVDADFAELVDDHCITMTMVFRQDAVKQRGFAGAQIAGKNRDRDARTHRGSETGIGSDK